MNGRKACKAQWQTKFSTVGIPEVCSFSPITLNSSRIPHQIAAFFCAVPGARRLSISGGVWQVNWCMRKVLTAAEMREVDRLTTEKYGIPSLLLMENAAHAVARVITEKLGGSVKGKSILILCGKGNNGGDGAALARVLWTRGANCFVYLLGRIEETQGDARINFEIIGRISESDEANWPNDNCLYLTEMSSEKIDNFIAHWNERERDCIVDALFGTGIARPPEGAFRRAIDSITSLRRHPGTRLIVSIDIPSGLDSDLQNPIGSAVSADVTVTFTAPKLANVLLPAAKNSGELIVANIGSVPGLIEEQPSLLFLAEKNDCSRWLRNTQFTDESYKNKRGHVLIVAGSEDYSGAAVMCGNSAMRSGVGLTTLLVPASCKVEIASRVVPEVIVRTIGETDGEVSLDAFAVNEDSIGQADSILVGPGLKATDKGVEKFVRKIVENRTVPVIVDAGALWFFNPPYCLSSGNGMPGENHPVGETPPPLLCKEGSLILTPHEGEFMRLLGTEDKSAISDRVAAVREFAVANNVILVLKGERVLIGSPDGRVVVNPTGNSGLGKAGNGDTLAGILAGFTAQAVKFEIDIFETVVAAVYVAGMAGDVAEKKYGKRVMTASDVRECLADVFSLFDDEEAE